MEQKFKCGPKIVQQYKKVLEVSSPKYYDGCVTGRESIGAPRSGNAGCLTIWRIFRLSMILVGP